MPDIHELLAAAARPPAAGVDVAAVVRRGRVLRRQRQAGVGAVMLLVLAVPVGVLAGGGAGGDDELVPVPGVTSTTAPPTPAPSRGGATPADVEPSAGGVGEPTPNESASPGALPTATGPTAAGTFSATPAATATTGPATSDHPPMRSCTVSTLTLAPGESDVCRFTATADGGWVMTQGPQGLAVFAGDYVIDVRIVVRRDGVARTYDDKCGTGLIRVGDRVTIKITQYESGYADYDLSAGGGYSCAD